MIDNGTVENSSHNVDESKVFHLPSMSNILLGDRGLSMSEDDDDASLNFEDLMNMKAPEGVNFHASYDQVPKAKVKITKKLKLKKNLNNSCPSFGQTNESETTENKTTTIKMKRKKSNKRSQSAAIERRAPNRSISFTADPPSHLGVEVPIPILPKRTNSLPMGYSIGISRESNENVVSNNFSSSGSAFQPHHSSITSTSAWTKESSDRSTPNMQYSMHQSFTIMPSESGEFLATSLAKDNRRGFRNDKNNSITVQSVCNREQAVKPRAPPRSNSLNISQVTGKKKQTRSTVNADCRQDTAEEMSSSPRRTPPPRRKSLDDLAVAIFKSPIKCEVSKRAVPRRKPSQRHIEKSEAPRRKSVASAEPRHLSPRRGISPRRHSSKRSTFIVRSKSAKLELATTVASESIKSDPVSPLAPRRSKSLYAGPKKPQVSSPSQRPRGQLHLPGPDTARRRFHDDVSVSASEAVPIASFAFSKHRPNKDHLRKAFKDTLDLVGKWKVKSKQEETHASLSPCAVKVAKVHTSASSSSAPQTCPTNEDQSHSKNEKVRMTRKSKQKMQDEDVVIESSTSEDLSSCHRERRHSSHQRGRKHPTKVDELAVDSLVDALEVREARLESYLTKTPQTERKKIDRYWIEAFKRNYARRNDLVVEKPTRILPRAKKSD